MLRAMGLDHKIEVGEWIRPAFRLLRAARRVRGTAFDVFGLAALRRTERALPTEYTAALDDALASCSLQSREAVLAVASAPDLVRGYEHVKEANNARFRAALAADPRAVA